MWHILAWLSTTRDQGDVIALKFPGRRTQYLLPSRDPATFPQLQFIRNRGKTFRSREVCFTLCHGSLASDKGNDPEPTIHSRLWKSLAGAVWNSAHYFFRVSNFNISSCPSSGFPSASFPSSFRLWWKNPSFRKTLNSRWLVRPGWDSQTLTSKTPTLQKSLQKQNNSNIWWNLHSIYSNNKCTSADLNCSCVCVCVCVSQQH